MKLIFDYSPWFILLFIITGAALSYIMYIRNAKEDFSKRLSFLLFGIRLVCFTAIAFFLLNPLLKMRSRQTEKPIIIFAQDNSESLLFTPDSAFYKNEYPPLIREFKEKLKSDFDVYTFGFGEDVSEGLTFDYSEKQTDMGKMLQFAQTTFYNRHVGAMIMASDGLYNTGQNPLYALRNISYPVYTIALGDTTVYKDIALEKINFNKLVFLNNRFPLEIIIGAKKAAGLSAMLKVSIDDRVVHTQNVQFAGENTVQTVTLSFEANVPGKRKVTAELTPIEGEVNVVNNAATIFFDVIDNRSKILLLSAAPHPDVAAIKNAVENNINYELISKTASDFTGSFDAYNLVVLHNLPSVNNASNHFFNTLNATDVPVFYIVGNQTNTTLFNRQQAGLNISTTRGNTNETHPAFNRNFSLFSLSDNTRQALQYLPPLYSLFGRYTFLPSAHVLFFQRIGNVVSDNPLLMFNDIGGKKTAILAGEGYWRWRLADFARNGHQEATNELINKTIQYLALKVEKDNFRLITADFFYENQQVVFEAEVYDESFELTNQEDVHLAITDNENKTFSYVFTRTENAYTLNAGRFPAGNYTYVARVKRGNQHLQKSGSFIVGPLNTEALNTIADHRLMYNLALRNDGAMFYPDGLSQLLTHLAENDDIKPVVYERIALSELINFHWLLFFIILLLGTEWFLRKWSGSY